MLQASPLQRKTLKKKKTKKYVDRKATSVAFDFACRTHSRIYCSAATPLHISRPRYFTALSLVYRSIVEAETEQKIGQNSLCAAPV
jgi:hypothetical protein